MSTSQKTDRIRETIRHADHQVSGMTRLHTDAIMRDEHKLFLSVKTRGCSCSNCGHHSMKNSFTRCNTKEKLVNPLALCHRWVAKKLP